MRMHMHVRTHTHIRRERAIIEIPSLNLNKFESSACAVYDALSPLILFGETFAESLTANLALKLIVISREPRCHAARACDSPGIRARFHSPEIECSL